MAKSKKPVPKNQIRKPGFKVQEGRSGRIYSHNGFSTGEPLGRKHPYIITGYNRKQAPIAHGVATGYDEMEQVRGHIYKIEHKWMKFSTRNTRTNRYLKG